MLDEWELAVFGTLSQNANTDKDGDGISDGVEYLMGTNPNNPTSFFGLTIQLLANNGKEVSFVAQAATGPGYQGKIRHYTLESTTSLESSVWQPVAGYVSVVGNGQRVRYLVPETEPQIRFYRVAGQLTDAAR